MLFGIIVLTVGVMGGVGLAILEIGAQMILRDEYERAICNDEEFYDIA